jgi:3-methylcrotonyl-CoA carboxylase alpha subunit
MPRLTLQPAGAATPLIFDVEWEAGPAGATRFTLAREQESLAGHGRLGPNGEGVLELGSRIVPFYVARSGDELQIWLDGELYRFTLPAPEQGARRRSHALATSGEVVSPMPGLVLQVHARPGEPVTAETPLVIMESMKMELTIPAPTDGTIAEVLCEPGQRVDRGAVLLRMEAPEEGRTG